MKEAVSQQHPVIEYQGQRLRVLKKDKFLGPYGWNVSKLIDVSTNDIAWDFRSDERSRLDQVLREGVFVQESEERATVQDQKNVPSEQRANAEDEKNELREQPENEELTKNGLKAVQAADGSEDTSKVWSIKVHQDGTLERDGSVGDRVAWAIEHQGRRVACKNAHACLTYKYSSSVEFKAFLVDMQTYSRCVSNEVQFLPPSSSASGFVEMSSESLDRSVDRSDFHIVPKDAAVAPKSYAEGPQVVSSAEVEALFPGTLHKMMKETILDKIEAGELCHGDAKTGHRGVFEDVATSIKHVLNESAQKCAVSEQSRLIAHAIHDEIVKVYDALLRQGKQVASKQSSNNESNDGKVSFMQERIKELDAEVQCLMEASKDYEKRYKLAEQDLEFAKEREKVLAERESDLKACLSGLKLQLEGLEEEKRMYLVEKKHLTGSYQSLLQEVHDVEAELRPSLLSLSTDFATMSGLLMEARANKDRFALKVEELEEQLEAAKSDNESLESRVIDLEEEVRELSSQSVLNGNNLKVASNRLSMLQWEQRHVKTALKDVCDELKETICLLADTQTVQPCQFADTSSTSSWAESLQSVEKLQRDIESVEEKLSIGMEMVKHKQTSLHILEQTSRYHERQKRALLEQVCRSLETLCNELQTVSAEATCTTIELGEQLDQLSSLQTHNNEHLEQTSSAESASESLASITSRHNRHVETLMCTHENTISALRTGFESQISALEQRISFLESIAQDKQDEVNELEEALVELEQEKDMEISRIRHESELAIVEMQAKLNAQDAMVSMLKDVDSSHRRSMSEMEFKTQERVDSAIESREIARLRTELEELQRLSQVRIQAKSERVRELEAALLRKADSLKSLRTMRSNTNTPQDPVRSGQELSPFVTRSVRMATTPNHISLVESLQAERSNMQKLSHALESMQMELHEQRRRAFEAEERLADICLGQSLARRSPVLWLKSWPSWLLLLALSPHPSLLPSATVTRADLIDGVTFYTLEVSHPCDKRLSWSMMKRFKHFCSLHENLLQELPAYRSSPPPPARLLYADRRILIAGSDRKSLSRRRDLIQDFLTAVMRIVEVLGSESLASFLALEEKMIDLNVCASVRRQTSSSLPSSTRGEDGKLARLTYSVAPLLDEERSSDQAPPSRPQEQEGEEEDEIEPVREEQITTDVGGRGGAKESIAGLTSPLARIRLSGRIPLKDITSMREQAARNLFAES